MPTYKQVIDCRRVDIDMVPDVLRLDMLRQQIRFRVEDLETDGHYAEAGSKGDVVDSLEAALHEHTRGLFALSVEYLDSYSPNPSMLVSVFFENNSDKSTFLKDYMTLLKLAN